MVKDAAGLFNLFIGLSILYPPGTNTLILCTNFLNNEGSDLFPPSERPSLSVPKIDYLLKPNEFDRFLNAVTKVKPSEKEKLISAERQEEKGYLFLTVQKKKVKLLFSEILYIESQKEYIRIVTTKKEWLSKITTHEMEDHLPSHLFKRIHRSFIVSINRIESYTAETGEVNGISIPAGRGYCNALENL